MSERPRQLPDLGVRLRNARQERSLSLRALAETTGFSASFLSQVELGQTSPSLASLFRICEALDVDLAKLLQTPQASSEPVVVRRDQRESLHSAWSRANAESVLPRGTDDLTALLISLEPGGRTGVIQRRPNARGFAYCTRGAVVLDLDSAQHRLEAGDCVVLDRVRTMAWQNATQRPAQVLVVAAATR
jgi:XRE family transcriptional regulator, regulator of sulfur utilization